MTAPPSDPILEAAAQIDAASCRNPHWDLGVCRRYFYQYPERAAAAIQEAARQIDKLRAAGVIPKGGE